MVFLLQQPKHFRKPGTVNVGMVYKGEQRNFGRGDTIVSYFECDDGYVIMRFFKTYRTLRLKRLIFLYVNYSLIFEMKKTITAFIYIDPENFSPNIFFSFTY